MNRELMRYFKEKGDQLMTNSLRREVKALAWLIPADSSVMAVTKA